MRVRLEAVGEDNFNPHGGRQERSGRRHSSRNNPFIARMIRSAGVTRSNGRGLAPIEPEGGVLVAYAAKHGTTAEDGSGANSPFAEALLANLEEPGLEIKFLFRRVRDQYSPPPKGSKSRFCMVRCRVRVFSSN